MVILCEWDTHRLRHFLAVTGMIEGYPILSFRVSIVGANMGDDTIYSGTVAAATGRVFVGYSVNCYFND